MKKQKGFTLIELLAVIVILAIIALIATPMIMDVIDKAKKGAAEASMNGYVESIEKSSIIGTGEDLTIEGLPAGVYAYDDEVITKIPSKGEKPTAGWIAINSKGYVEAADLKFNSYGNSIAYVSNSVGKATKTAEPSTKPADVAAAKKAAEEALGKTTTPEAGA